MALLLIERFGIILFLLIAITQVVVPMLLGRPTFPILRWRRYNNELSSLAEQEEAVELERTIKTLRHRVEEIKCSTNPATDSKEADRQA
jgi:hypothetical protein